MDERTNREAVDEAAASAYLAAFAGRDDLKACGERVSLLRTLGRLDEAAREGEAALARARRQGTPRQQVAALLRLAHVRQWRRARRRRTPAWWGRRGSTARISRTFRDSRSPLNPPSGEEAG
jgi:hypothetical protein